jgi:hypothetical protein
MRQEARVGDALGRGVEQHQRPAIISRSMRWVVARLERAVQEGGVHAHFFERADLVVHQRNQRARPPW